MPRAKWIQLKLKTVERNCLNEDCKKVFLTDNLKQKYCTKEHRKGKMVKIDCDDDKYTVCHLFKKVVICKLKLKTKFNLELKRPDGTFIGFCESYKQAKALIMIMDGNSKESKK